ncbi:MAG: hypothetical protein J6B12_01905 [Clostridia bacterium]|nr:hypothetical protein [Clostridia bacterium]
MNKLKDILDGRVENRLFPFLCVYGDENEEMLVDTVTHIYHSGARALCVESKRPNPTFMTEQWWFTMDVILREAKRLGMKVWMVDEPYVPSGYANGAVKNYPHLKKRHLVETHTDVLGPVAGAKIMFRKTSAADQLLGVFAYRRADGESETLTGEAMDLTDGVEGGLLYCDIPDGLYRIFFLYESTAYADNYLDYFNRDSVELAITAVYEPHYQRYKEYFPDTFAGFFSDEPAFRNPSFDQSKRLDAFAKNTVGRPYIAMPWGKAVWERMERTLGNLSHADLIALWYELDERHTEIRCAYMDAATSLFDENFNRRLQKWCAEHGVIYTGHIVEDGGVHARMGGGVGHYFRAMNAYEMAGVDIVLNQVFPGHAHSRHTANCGGGFCDTDFFHYVLGQLAASASHAQPQKTGKTLCEIFGAYGWGEDISMMKWLVDFMLVRGVTTFVPHSFTTHTHDAVFPPTFSAKNNDPQFDGLKKLCGYVNRAGALLAEGTHVASVAVAYTAFAEWSDLRANGQMDLVARQLYDGHLNFDILSEDTLLEGVCVERGRLLCNRESYGALIVPYAPRLPKRLIARLAELAELGVPLIFVNERPLGVSFGEVLELQRLAQTLLERGMADVKIEDNELLRYYHCFEGKRHVYMFFNESADEPVSTKACVGQKGDFLRLDLLRGEALRGESKDGMLHIGLSPYESAIFVFDEFSEGELLQYPLAWSTCEKLDVPTHFSVYTAPYDDAENFTCLTDTEEFFDITARDRLPDFAGVVKYTATFVSEKQFEDYTLSLGEVGGAARVILNGEDCGLELCAPYRFLLGHALKKGENHLEILVYTSLANAMRCKGNFTEHTKALMSTVPLRYCGIRGPITLLGHR